jgi:hypothetical protein
VLEQEKLDQQEEVIPGGYSGTMWCKSTKLRTKLVLLSLQTPLNSKSRLSQVVKERIPMESLAPPVVLLGK